MPRVAACERDARSPRGTSTRSTDGRASSVFEQLRIPAVRARSAVAFATRNVEIQMRHRVAAHHHGDLGADAARPTDATRAVAVASTTPARSSCCVTRECP